MRFTFCFNLKKPKLRPDLFACHYMESFVALTDHLSDAFAKTLHASSNDIGKFDADAILFREIQCKKRSNSMFKGFWLESGKICKNNDHTFLFHCINTFWVPRMIFEHSA